MNPNVETLAAWSAGWKRAGNRLGKLRIKAIRESDISKSLSSFDLAFKSAMKLALPRKIAVLNDLQKIFLMKNNDRPYNRSLGTPEVH